MAKLNGNGEGNAQYINAVADDFSEKVQALLKTEREIYDLLKQAKAEVLAAVKAEMPVEQGREVKGTVYTRWGQWQIIVGDAVKAKAPVAGRKTLAEYRAEMAAQGQNA